MHDEKTMCMKSDTKISLLVDVVEGHHEESMFIALSNLFSSRLRDFYIAHSEGCHVPEAALPQPFNQRSITIKADSISKDFSSLCETEELGPSHFPHSFTRHFYNKPLAAEMEKTDLLSPITSASVTDEETERLSLLPGPASSKTNASELTPMKLTAASNNLLVETPIQSTPARLVSPTRPTLTCEDEDRLTANENAEQSNSTAEKSLNFYSMNSEDMGISRWEVPVCLSDLCSLDSTNI